MDVMNLKIDVGKVFLNIESLKLILLKLNQTFNKPI